MRTEDQLKQRSAELSREVSAKFNESNMSPVELKSFLDKATEESDSIGIELSNLRVAKGFRAGNDLTDGEGSPVETRAHEGAEQSKLDETFLQMKSFAANRQRGSFSFDLGVKAQGGTGVMGDAAAGTTAPAALAGGSYFLTGAAGASILPQFIPGITELQFYENVIAGLFDSTPVDSPIVSYVRETAWTNNAAATAEAATKPTSTNAVGRLTEQVGKITNLAHVTDEMIQDAPYFWSLVQRRVPQGVKRQEEVQLLAGSGMPGVNGLLNRSTGFTQGTAGLAAVTGLVIPVASTPGAGTASSTIASVTPGRQIKGTGSTGTAPTGVQIAEGIFAALNDIRFKTFFDVDAILFNPQDWATIRLAKDSAGQYLGGSFFGTNYGNNNSLVPSAGAVDEGLTLWGKRVITTPVVPQGFILIGAFKLGGTVLRKGGMSVESTNTNGTDFEQNLWTIRAEERVGLLVERPEVFELIQLAVA